MLQYWGRGSRGSRYVAPLPPTPSPLTRNQSFPNVGVHGEVQQCVNPIENSHSFAFCGDTPTTPTPTLTSLNRCKVFW